MPEVRGTERERQLAWEAARDFADLLRREMAHQGVTQTEMASRLGVSKTRVCQMLCADNLTLRTMAAALDALGRRLVVRAA